MKKFIALLMVIAIVMAFSVLVYADEIETEPTETLEETEEAKEAEDTDETSYIISVLEALKKEVTELKFDQENSVTTYVEDTIVPFIVSIVTAICSIYLLISPMLMRVKKSKANIEKSAGLFADAASDVKKAIEERKSVEDMTNEIYELRSACESMANELAKAKTENEHLVSEVISISAPMKEEMEKLKSACSIAFLNTQELVQKGYANTINQIMNGVKENDDSKVKDEIDTH